MNTILPNWNCQQCTALCHDQQKIDASQLPLNNSFYCNFPVKIVRSEHLKAGPIFEKHWHEQIQILYFKQGEALIHCNTSTYSLKSGDIMIINSNEIHYGVTSNEYLVYYMVKVDFNFLFSSHQDLCQTKYITPLLEGYTRFQNQISQDRQLSIELLKTINEYTDQKLGCELVIKAQIYHILVYLLRHYQQPPLQPAERERQQKTLHQLRAILSYIDEHYTETIRLNQLASLANMSRQHFCRIFKIMTGKRPMDYINLLRINKAITLLSENHLNISEIATTVGFDDSNYFSRIFKKYTKSSPSSLRKK